MVQKGSRTQINCLDSIYKGGQRSMQEERIAIVDNGNGGKGEERERPYYAEDPP